MDVDNGKWALDITTRDSSALARHRPAEAVDALQAALEECPPSQSQDLYQICLFLGIALRRVGYPAVRHQELDLRASG